MTRILPIQRFTVYGNSMQPTLSLGQDILSFNWAYLGRKPKVGDIVVIKQDGREMVKRIQKVDGRHIFVTGDNKEQSTDSRHFGPVNMDQIIGKVIYASSHPELDSGSIWIPDQVRNDMIDCSNCGSAMLGIAGRKDAICNNCGFKLACCGEP